MSSVCGSDLFNQSWIQVLWIAFSISISLCSILLIRLWYQNRLNFPIMERSPMLSIYFIINALIYLVSYPIIAQVEWLSSQANSLWLKSILVPVRGSYTYIYLLKSIRLAWGFRKPKQISIFSRYTDTINSFLKFEWKLLVCCVFFFILNAIFSVIASDGQYVLLDFIDSPSEEWESEVNNPIEQQNVSMNLVARMSENIIGLIYLLASIIMVSNVDVRVNIISELHMIFLFDFIVGVLKHLFLILPLGVSNEITLCLADSSLPILYILNSLKLLLTIYVGINKPLQIIDEQHKYQAFLFISDAENVEFFVSNQPERLLSFLNYCRGKQIEMNETPIYGVVKLSDIAMADSQGLSEYKDFTKSLLPLTNIPKQKSLPIQPVCSSSNEFIPSEQALNSHSLNERKKNYFDSQTPSTPLDRTPISCGIGGGGLKDFGSLNLSEGFQTRKQFLKQFEYETVIMHMRVLQFKMGVKRWNETTTQQFKGFLLKEMEIAPKFLDSFDEEVRQEAEFFIQNDCSFQEAYGYISSICKVSKNKVHSCIREFRKTQSYTVLMEYLHHLKEVYSNLLDIDLVHQ